MSLSFAERAPRLVDSGARSVLAIPRRGSDEDLLSLRALQTRRFLDAVARWEHGEEPEDFAGMGGAFVRESGVTEWGRTLSVMGISLG